MKSEKETTNLKTNQTIIEIEQITTPESIEIKNVSEQGLIQSV